ncbi:Protein priB [Grifola frondosa]|uniref:Protein priB n=1 Tax=Grifola frondosa TaxID=5627 RepID=A0A1C7MFN9_GRIFR|nr:Protein priB [Grifola frondosa]
MYAAIFIPAHSPPLSFFTSPHPFPFPLNLLPPSSPSTVPFAVFLNSQSSAQMSHPRKTARSQRRQGMHSMQKAKMKCVGAEDGTQPCQRCKRSGNTCVFEKHRRGRKPGSKLSEASKMLRRLEKGLTTAKAKRPPNNITLPAPVSSSTGYHREISPGNPFHNNELPPILNHPSSCSSDDDMDEDENRDRNHQGMVPAKVINKEKEKSFFNVVMNPHHTEPLLPRSTTDTSRQQSSPSQSPPSGKSMNSPPPSFSDGLFTRSFKDPVAAGLVTDVEVSRLFDLFYLRLNPFINLFDASLHSAEYVREKCSFLFTVIIMAVCKFFKPECYAATRRLAQDMAILAFAEGQQTIEVVQAYMCLTYWKEPEDNRTWTYIGYASRMAVGLELNRYVGKRSTHESDLQMRERRNRERTYLVLFVHDRSLSMQTAKQWMLPEGDLVRHVKTWLEEGGSPIRPEDVIIAAFVELRLIGSEATDSFYKHQHAPASYAVDANHDNELKSCNSKLDAWVEEWLFEMRKAGGTSFHYTFLKFFQFHVRLFLNSFGINGSISQMSRVSPNYVAVKECYNSAMSNLTIVAKDFADMGILRYGQESITVMTAYAAVVLLKLLRSSDSGPSQTEDIYTLINRTASAYEAGGCPSSDPRPIMRDSYVAWLKTTGRGSSGRWTHIKEAFNMLVSTFQRTLQQDPPRELSCPLSHVHQG